MMGASALEQRVRALVAEALDAPAVAPASPPGVPSELVPDPEVSAVATACGVRPSTARGWFHGGLVPQAYRGARGEWRTTLDGLAQLRGRIRTGTLHAAATRTTGQATETRPHVEPPQRAPATVTDLRTWIAGEGARP